MSNVYGKSCTPNLGGVSNYYTKEEVQFLLSGKLGTNSLYTNPLTRTFSLSETELPIPYDAASMPGASVLGTDGQIYSSIKVGATYEWSKAPRSLETGELILGDIDDPRQNISVDAISGGLFFVPAVQLEGTGQTSPAFSVIASSVTPSAATVPRYILGASRGGAGVLQDQDNAGILLFMGGDGTNIISGASVTALVDGTPSANDMPMRLDLRTRAQGAGNLLTKLRITPDGNVLVGNTTGTEKLSVTGNIKASGSLIGDTLSISGQSVRTTALQETALPIALDATTMPGASVLGTDGQIYSSIKIGGTYQWSRAPRSLETGELLLGEITSPRDDFLVALNVGGLQYVPALQIEGVSGTNSSLSIVGTGTDSGDWGPRFLMGKSRGQAGVLLDGDPTAVMLFMGHDGTNMVSGAGITTEVDGTPGTSDMPMEMYLRTRAQGGIGPSRRLTITPDGNVLINNTTGTEKLDVTGNIKASGSLIGSTLSLTPQIYTQITGSLSPGSSEDFVINSGSILHLLSLTASTPAWVRVYGTSAARDADTRTEPGAPIPASGTEYYAEVVTTQSPETVRFSPVPLVQGTNGQAFIRVVNKDTSDRVITLDFATIKLGD